ncbi:PucR family transcriptional regulator [Streptomyces sp. NPDC058424]|uniref:PucR family transcriptional regulator n=1 Tax=Streptomyces sp. NPDC058424 TaxID=3346491 RepID=UPI0036468DBC
MTVPEVLSHGATTLDLAARLEAETRFGDVRSRGGSLSDLVRALSDALGSAAYLVDLGGRMVARAVPSDSEQTSIPTLERLLGAASADHAGWPCTVLVPALPVNGIPRRHLLAPVALEGHLFGWLVVGESPTRPAMADRWIVDRAAAHLRGEYIAQRRLARVAWNARANLGRQMIRSSSYDEDLRACAEYLGVDLHADRVIVFVLERERPSGSTVDAGRLAELVVADLGVEVLPIRGSEGALLAVVAPSGEEHAALIRRIKSAVTRGLETMGDRFAIAGLSSVTKAGQLRRAYREAWEAARCLDRYASTNTRAIGCDELGPARLFVANSDEHAVRTYVHDVLGPLLGGGAGMLELLRTLQCFFEAGRSVRESAALLRVHENTVRHRLTRVHDLTGLDVASNSNDQLSVHTALLVLRLQGHHAVPGFDHGNRQAPGLSTSPMRVSRPRADSLTPSETDS